MADDGTKTKPVTLDDIVTMTAQHFKNNYVLWSAPKHWPWDGYPTPMFEPPKDTVVGYVEAWRWWIPKARHMLRPIYPPAGEAAYRPGTNVNAISFSTEQYIEYSPGSNNTSYVWDWDVENVASESPTFENSHGFYAYNLEGIEDHANPLFGRVALYGDVVHCKYGYRAEKARILDVWVDKDYIKANPSVWEELRKIPQVKGTFDTFDPSVYNADGSKGDHQCLILEHQKELSGTSLSDGRTIGLSSNQTFLIIDQRPSSRRHWTTQSTYALAPVDKQWVVKPDGDECNLCGRMIMDGEAVAVSFEFPDDYLQKIHDHEFQWTRRKCHLECEAAMDGMNGAQWEYWSPSIPFANNVPSPPVSFMLNFVERIASV